MPHINRFHIACQNRLLPIAVLVAMVVAFAVASPTADAKPKNQDCDAEAAEETGCIQSPRHTNADRSHAKTVRSASPASRAAPSAGTKATAAVPAAAEQKTK